MPGGSKAGALEFKSRGDVIANRDLDARPDGFVRSSKKKFGRFSIDIFFAAVGADVRRNVFDHERGSIPLQSHNGFPRSRLTHLADHALHGFLLLLKPGSHSSRSG